MVEYTKSRLNGGALVVFIVVFLSVFLLVVITTTLVTFILPESFASSARIKVERRAGNDAATAGQKGALSFYDPYLIQTEFEIIQSELILKDVVAELDLNAEWGKKYIGGNEKLKTSETLGILRSRLQLHPVRGTSLIEIQVFSEQPKEAADIANAITRAYANYVLSSSNGIHLQVVDSAQPGIRPVRPNKPLNIALGILAGVVLGLGAGSLGAWIVFIWRRRTPRPPPIP